MGGVPVQVNPAAWIFDLQFENDDYLKSYIKEGIQYGFDIVDVVENVMTVVTIHRCYMVRQVNASMNL